MPSIGETFRVTATLRDILGSPLGAPTSQSVNLYRGSSLEYTDNAPVNEGGGIFHVDFTTVSTDASGLWLVIWTVIDGTVTGIGKEKVYIDDPPI